MRAIGLLFLLVFLGCGEDAKPTTVAVDITSPEDGAILNSSRVAVSGTAKSVEFVEVNGNTVDVIGGEWTTVLTVADGPLEVVVTAQSASDNIQVTVDSTAPQIVIESPERGFYAQASEGTTVEVRGRIEDSGTGISALFSGGQSITVDADGGFSFESSLREGLNVIEVTAVDVAGNESTSLRGGMYGEYTSPTESVDRAFQLFIRQEALETIEKVVEETVTPEFVTDFVTRSFMNDNVTIETITFDPIDLEIITRVNDLQVALNVANVAVTGSFRIGNDSYPTTIEILKMGVTLPLTISATPEGSLGLSFGTAVLQLEDADLRYNIDGLTQDDASFLRNVMRQVAEYAFGNLISERVFEQLFDPAILKRRVEVFGRVITFELKFQNVRVFPDGILLDLSVTMPDDQFDAVRDVPGALNRIPGNPNGPVSENDLLFTTTHQALDRILHGVWRSGLLHQTFDSSTFEGFNLPVNLSAGELALVLDSRIAGLAPAGTPAAIRLRPLLPPIVDLSGESGLTIRMGELMMDLVLQPAGQAEVLVASFSFFLDLDATVNVEGVEIILGFDADVRADLADEPQFDLDDAKSEGLFTDVIGFVPQILADSLRLNGEADITWVTLTNPELELHGNEDHITLSAGMVPNPDGFVLEF